MWIFSPNTKARSQEVNDNFADLASGVGDLDNNRLALTRGEAFSDFVASGCMWAVVSGLQGAMTEGIAYVTQSSTGLMFRVEVAEILGHTFTANKDTYVDVDYQGNITYIEEDNNDPAPALTTDSIRLARVVTGASTISEFAQSGFDGSAWLRNPAPSTADKRSQVVASGVISGATLNITGNHLIAGLGFRPKSILFFSITTPSTAYALGSHGYADAERQYYSTWRSHPTQGHYRNSGTDNCIAEVTTSSSSLALAASLVSLDPDGFTINVSTPSSSSSFFWIAFA